MPCGPQLREKLKKNMYNQAKNTCGKYLLKEIQQKGDPQKTY